MEKLKAPLPFINQRAEKTALVMEEILGDWQAPNFVSPTNYSDMVASLTPTSATLTEMESLTDAAAGAWDMVLKPWHDASVKTVEVARGAFKDTEFAPVWRSLRANGKSRELITKQGTAIEKAWKSSGVTWKPTNALTFAVFSAFRANAKAKADLHGAAKNNEDVARGILNDLANNLHDLSVRWYEMATGAFAPDTPQGSLIRTIPTSYNPDEAPGRLHFQEHYSPAPNQLRLGWHAARGQRYNVYAKRPGAAAYELILTEVTTTSWMGEGLEAGTWKFKGEAINAEGLGEMSIEVTISVSNAAAA
jgi:hypothetical protein